MYSTSNTRSGRSWCKDKMLLCSLIMLVMMMMLDILWGHTRNRHARIVGDSLVHPLGRRCIPSTRMLSAMNGDHSISVGPYQILSYDGMFAPREDDKVVFGNIIRLVDIKSGWGNGAHPTTKLCLDFVLSKVTNDSVFLDYGCGSGILSILAAKLGASRCVSVDIDEDSLSATRTNAALNGVADVLQVVHTKEVYIGEDSYQLADVTVANILPGPLSRLVAPLWMLTKPGGCLCLSGLRPHELSGIRRIYAPYMDLATESVDTARHDEYGEWVRWVVQTKRMDEAQRRQALAMLTQASVEY